VGDRKISVRGQQGSKKLARLYLKINLGMLAYSVVSTTQGAEIGRIKG
jgi:hypothetical protein